MIDNDKAFNVWVNPTPATASYEIWVYEKQFGSNISTIHFENGELIRVAVPENSMWAGEGAKPFMRIPFIMARHLFPELIAALQKQPNNFTPVPEATLIGELKATASHLADMQKITDKLFTLLENEKGTTNTSRNG